MSPISKLFSLRERFIAAILASAVMFTVGVLIINRGHQLELKTTEAELKTLSEGVYNKLQEIFGTVGSLSVLHQVSGEFQSDELDVYAENILDQSDVIKTFGRYERLRSEEVAEFSELMREQGIYDFQISTLQPNSSRPGYGTRQYHNAVTRILPFTPAKSRMIGVDLSGIRSIDEALWNAVNADNPLLVSYPDGWAKSADMLLIYPTYAGRYVPTTMRERHRQNDGGYFLELDFHSLLDHTPDLSYEVILPDGISFSHQADESNRYLNSWYEGNVVSLSPKIGADSIQIRLKTRDGVELRSIRHAFIGVLCTAFIMLLGLVLVKSNRITEKERQEAQVSLEKERELALTTIEALNDSVFTVDHEGEISYVNPSAEIIVERPAAGLIGRCIDTVLSINGDSRPIVKSLKKSIESGSTEKLTGLTIEERGTVREIDCTISPYADGGVFVLRDVSTEKALNRRLQYLATHDSLTGLSNRYHFEICLAELVEERKSFKHAVCYIDIDQFKIVNDTCGHTAGDELLKLVAEGLKKVIREDDTLARLGGDEFGLLLRDCGNEQAETFATRIFDFFQTFYYTKDEHTFSVRASIGFVEINDAMDDPSEVMAAADIACYSAKDRGRNDIHIFQSSCEETAQLRGEMMLLPKVQNALTLDKFVLFVQPIGRLTEDGIVEGEKFEILLRMQEEDGRLITPFRLITAAERYDLMKEIDRWVIDKAFSDIAEIHKNNSDNLPMFSINLSGQSVVDSELIGYIMGKLVQYHVPPKKLCFEITETSAISNLDKALVLLNFLHELGCKIALDDFGAGECSFGYLKKIPVDYLKVDGQFVQDMDTCPVNKEMMAFVKRVADLQNMKTVAEFVENETVVGCLRELKIDYVQGYHISEPYSIEVLKNQQNQWSKAA